MYMCRIQLTQERETLLAEEELICLGFTFDYDRSGETMYEVIRDYTPIILERKSLWTKAKVPNPM